MLRWGNWLYSVEFIKRYFVLESMKTSNPEDAQMAGPDLTLKMHTRETDNLTITIMWVCNPGQSGEGLIDSN